MIQILLLFIGVIWCALLYILLINKASTEGYFLRKANNSLDNTNFSYRIVKADILELKQKNREKITNSDLYGPSLGLLDATIESVVIADTSQHAVR